MYLAKLTSGGYVNNGGYGSLSGLRGTADVIALQQALLAMSLKTGNPAINPGAQTGELTPQTMTAMQAALAYISKDLPSYVFLPLQAGFLAGSSSSTVKGYVSQYATQLAMAVNTATAKLGPATPGGVVLLPTAATTPWYQTTFGMIAIGAVVLGLGWYFLIRDEPAKAA